MTIAQDDAPATTSKDKEVRTQDVDTLPQPKGDTLLGRTVTINRPRAELFAYWADLTNLPAFMDNVERIDMLSDTRSHWVVKAPAGKTVEWDAVITDKREVKTVTPEQSSAILSLVRRTFPAPPPTVNDSPAVPVTTVSATLGEN